ncbi:carbohydrate ABC transporter permease [Pseudonocardia sichuanensis]|uniref:Carbohydrate ABC transporter membrane protein 2 (CUT1 family) n=1 Tax=Pseudonocardia kunmingensis TaxID=630975 RepID=A0A543DWI9_9PSEU|nr:carbohydrate ABC transporter permease [Pseudonocardia kunmingensis]TQM13676.1 carbohydrate ABC transporter membrane protein 2 (CUT1 family) [Pseudonocardia kunmingensis]
MMTPARTPASVAAAVARYAALVVATLLFLLPFYLMLRNAFATDAEITGVDWTLFPSSLQWGNVAEAFSDSTANLGRSLANSAFIALAQTAGTVVLSSMAGYALARIPFRFATPIFYAVLMTLMVPPAVTFVPSFIIVARLGWVNSYQGIIVPVLFSGFTAFLFRQYFLNFPRELEEAGRIDGLGYVGVFCRIVVPNSLAFFAAISVITVINAWNQFLWPLVVGQDQSMWTVQVSLSTLMTAQTINLHQVFMAALISIVPLVLVFVFLQRYLVQGVAETGIKG